MSHIADAMLKNACEVNIHGTSVATKSDILTSRQELKKALKKVLKKEFKIFEKKWDDSMLRFETEMKEIKTKTALIGQRIDNDEAECEIRNRFVHTTKARVHETKKMA